MRPVRIESAIGEQEAAKLERGQLIDERDLLLDRRARKIGAGAQPRFGGLDGVFVREVGTAIVRNMRNQSIGIIHQECRWVGEMEA